MSPITPLAAIAARRGFSERFGREPALVAAAPGRVNLIGEHVDYCGGVVLPMGIDRYTAIAVAPAPGGRETRIGSAVFDETLAVDARGGREAIAASPRWARYVLGVVQLIAEAGDRVPAFDAWVESDVPVGAGLSSSAAVEVATATAIDAMIGREREAMERARLCQRAEHEFAGVPCGIMDQAASAAARAGHALLLDCRSGVVGHVAMDDPAVSVLIANTNVRHALADGEYARRRGECETAAGQLGVATLRDATPAMLEAARDRLGPVVHRRARHVVGEIDRTIHAAALLAQHRWEDVGRLMFASHASLRDDFEVSCAELDAMVEIARSIGVADGVYGARMTGGGFGGCTVWLIASERACGIAERLHEEYRGRTGLEATVFTTRPSQGAHVVATGM